MEKPILATKTASYLIFYTCQINNQPRGTDMKYNYVYEMFNDMMNFALTNGMTSYQSDLMHDAVQLNEVEAIGDPVKFLWIVKSNGYGTWLWNCANDIPSVVSSNTGAKAVIEYDGDCWTFDKQ